MEPLVSVVIAVHDDRDRLPRALRSALVPGVLEVLVVDDGSTDGSADVAQAVAEQDPRVRVLRRAARSGFPGVPRNEGIDAARGRYVLLLDSDDELEEGAVALLLAEAERTGADAVFGRTTRFNPSRGTSTEWMPWLFSSTGTTSMAERPSLVGDTTVGGKLVRRSALGDARFPTDVLYEDLVFAASVAVRLGVVVVTDVPLYRWYVRADADDRSISNSRREAGNLEARLEANRRARAVLLAAGRDDLRIALDRKVVDHDLPLLLRDLVDRDPVIRDEVLGNVVSFVGELHPGVLGSSSQPGALVLAALATGSRDEVMAASALAYRRQLTRPVALQDGRWRWAEIDGVAGDVTDLVAPLLKDGAVVAHVVQALEATGDRLRLTVTSTVFAGAVAGQVELGLLVVDRRRKRRVAWATAVTGPLTAGVTWQAEVSLARGLRQVERLGELDVRVTVGAAGAEPVRWVLAVPERLVHGVTGAGRRWGRERQLVAYQTALGNLSLRRVR